MHWCRLIGEWRKYGRARNKGDGRLHVHRRAGRRVLSPGGAERKCDVACRCRRPPPRAEKVRKFGARPRSTRRRFEIGETRDRDIPIWRFLKLLKINSYLCGGLAEK